MKRIGTLKYLLLHWLMGKYYFLGHISNIRSSAVCFKVVYEHLNQLFLLLIDFYLKRREVYISYLIFLHRIKYYNNKDIFDNKSPTGN